ncbi:MAG TPA: PadR family transcriptional regulator [Bacillales bacterium]
MSLRYAILGLLSKQEATGYELTQRFRKTTIHFWYAHHTQIYRELAKMEKEELVGYRVVHQEDHPDKKIYTIKDKGFQELLSWLLESEIDPPKLKDSRLLKVSLFHLIPTDRSIRFLEKSRREHVETLQGMEFWKEHHLPENQCYQSKIGEYLTLEFGIRAMKTWIDWCDWAIEVLRKSESLREE